MIDWELSLDRYLTNPPDDPESNFLCGECKDPIYPNDEYYVIDGVNLCEDCAREWLYQQKHIATEEQCYGV